jgi:hypothetical protein
MKERVTQLREPANKKDVKDYFSKVYKASSEVLDEIADTYVQEQRHHHRLARMYPDMKIDDIKALAELVSEQDIEEYERDSGN